METKGSGKYLRLFGIRFYPGRLKNKDAGWVMLDLLMLFLVTVNIALFIFWWFYGYYRVQHFFELNFPAIHKGILNPLYTEFPLIDFIFVSIFLGEFLLRWGWAVYRKVYHRWFFFPFIYWYDLLGSIPFGSFRFLRILRVFALLRRLQQMEVLDLRQTYLYTRFQKYRSILVEEVSDRVVLNVINGLQKEVREGLPVTDRVFREVLDPYRETLVAWLAQRLKEVAKRGHDRYQIDLEKYLDEKVKTAVAQNPEIDQLKLIPVVGPQVANLLESAIQDITFSVINGMFEDMATKDQYSLLDELSLMTVETVLHEDQKPENEAINRIIQGMVLESLEVVKKHVQIQEWKLRDRARREGFETLAEPMEGDEDLNFSEIQRPDQPNWGEPSLSEKAGLGRVEAKPQINSEQEEKV